MIKVAKVTKIIIESPNTVSILSKPDSDEMALPGQFHMLQAFGIGECAISISDTRNPNRLTHTICNVGPVTNALSNLKKNQPLLYRGPFGTGWPVSLHNDEIILIAGGLGIAPIRALIFHLLEQQCANRMTLLYGAREPDYLLYQNELTMWSKQFNVQLIVDTANEKWEHHVGALPSILSGYLKNPQTTQVYVCGPEIMLKFIIQLLKQKMIPSSKIHISLERNMQCGTGICGHCQWGRFFICKDGPVLPFSAIESQFYISEL